MPTRFFLPIGKEDHFTGVIDVVNQKAIVYDPSDDVRARNTRSRTFPPS